MNSQRLRRRGAYAIRPARQDDLDAVTALEARCFPAGHYSRRSLAFHLKSARAAVIVAESGGQVRGFALVLLRKASRRGRLVSLAVEPAFRRMGLGSALLRAAEIACILQACAGLRLEARKSRAAFYFRRGYRPIAELQAYYADGADALRLEKPLPPHGGRAMLPYRQP